MSAVSVLIPLAGLVTAPLLARALSAGGRGDLAAALAPAGLMLAAATLGLPDALTFYLAKHPAYVRPMVVRAVVVTFVLGLLCFAVTWVSLPLLSADSESLRFLILLASASTVPALAVNVLRGAALGRQMWRSVASERIVIVTCRVVGFTVLFSVGQLTVLNALLVNLIPPVVAGMVYLKLLRRPVDRSTNLEGRLEFRQIGSYGSRVWLGSVASMTLSRITPLLMVPLSSSRDLGLYTVASTVSDLPLVIALGIQGAVFGVNSMQTDAAKLAEAGRLALIVTVGGCLALGLSLPYWLVPLFGADFKDAFLPAILLLTAAVVTVPGLNASTALSAWGRPGLRSIGLALSLVITLGLFITFVPAFGVLGAALTSIIGSLVLTTFNVLVAAPLAGLAPKDFVLVRGADFARLVSEGGRFVVLLKSARASSGGRFRGNRR